MSKERIKNGLMLFAFFFRMFYIWRRMEHSGADGAGVCR